MSNYSNKEMIQQMLNGELTEEDLALFQDKYARDADFAHEVRQYLKIRSALKAAKKAQKEYSHSGTGKSIQMPESSRFKVYLIAASIAIFLLVFTWIFIGDRSPDHEKLFTEYYQPFDSRINARNPKDSSNSEVSELMSHALSAYKEQAYRESIQNLEQVLTIDPPNVTAKFYLAQCYLNVNETEKAILSFQEVVAGEHSTYTQDASWYLALAYLKKGEAESCREQLQKIIANKRFYKERAEQLMGNIEKL